MAQSVRYHWPDDLTLEKFTVTGEAIEAPWGRRYERELGKIYKDESLVQVDLSQELIVKDLGLQPFEAQILSRPWKTTR